jgi:glycosyltransferase involved in cell wall biosynthesis
MRVPSDEEVTKMRSEWGLDGKFVCAYIGTIGMACGLDIYLRAAGLLLEKGIRDIALVAVGDGAMRETLEQQARDKALDCILFTGLQPKASMPTWLTLADVCFVHLKKTPLFETVIPSKIFESFGFCRPIVIGVHGDAQRLVEASGGGFTMEPENETQLVDQLVRLRNDSARRLALGTQGRRYVESHFSRDVLSERYLSILRGLVKYIDWFIPMPLCRTELQSEGSRADFR